MRGTRPLVHGEQFRPRAIILYAGENHIVNGQRLQLTAQYLPRARRKPFCCGGVDAGRGA